MTKEFEKEVIKSIAYCYTDEQIVDVYDISIEELQSIRSECNDIINSKINELKEQGWF